MAYKIYTKSNYFYIVDTTNDKIFEGLAKDVRVRKEFLDSTDFIFENVNGFSTSISVPFASIQDESGVAYADLATFVAFYEANTGNFNSGGATPQFKSEYYAWLNQTYIQQTSGTLIVGHKYWIKTLNVLDDFTNVGGVNEENTRFIATGITPTSYIGGSVLVDITLSSTQAEIIYNGLGFVPTYEYQSIGFNLITLPNTDYKKVYIPNIFRNDWQEQQVGIESYITTDGTNTFIRLQQCDLSTILTDGGASEIDNYTDIPYKIEIYN